MHYSWGDALVRLVRAVGALALLAGLLTPWQGSAVAQSPAGNEVYVVRLEGVVNPVTARHVLRHLRAAEERGSEAFILTMDTPGGLDSAMRDIVKGLLNARVPTVVYVSPKGARAASAGAFITAAAHVAAMAPGTNIGAASPVSLGAELPETVERKATNDAAAYIREIALVRKRNPDWLEDTVRKAVSAPATEALELGVIDLIAEDLPSLLQMLDGKAATVNGAEQTLQTKDASVFARGMGFFSRVLNFIADPTIATLLISLGSLALVIELYNPSVMVGVVGGIALALGLVGVGNLPVNWVGVALILAGAVLLALELVVSGFGALGIGSFICFVVGMVLLFSNYEPSLPGAPAFRISPWVIGALSAVVGAVIFFLVVVILRSGRITQLPRESVRLVGQTGVVTSDLAPRGTVQLAEELWTAEAEGETPISSGKRVEVVSVSGLVLTVRQVGGSSSGPRGAWSPEVSREG